MKYNFQLQDFPNANFELEHSIWTGKSTLLKDDVSVERSKGKGKPFLIPGSTGNLVEAYPKQSLPDFIPTLVINGMKNSIVEELKWYEYVLGGLPLLLVFLGGLLGGIVGVIGSHISYRIIRQEGSKSIIYLKVLGVTVASYAIFLLLAGVFQLLIS